MRVSSISIKINFLVINSQKEKGERIINTETKIQHTK